MTVCCVKVGVFCRSAIYNRCRREQPIRRHRSRPRQRRAVVRPGGTISCNRGHGACRRDCSQPEPTGYSCSTSRSRNTRLAVSGRLACTNEDLSGHVCTSTDGPRAKPARGPSVDRRVRRVTVVLRRMRRHAPGAAIRALAKRAEVPAGCRNDPHRRANHTSRAGQIKLCHLFWSPMTQSQIGTYRKISSFL
ncbi:MAG: hypothetical protein QOK44_5053 [Betaproteobacteria bacterium]|jgi:hypothetical protein|nr:hypothetical protein [Betaproteobacteria bacterium]